MRRALFGLALALASAIAGAQDWPSKPVRFVVPYPPGGGTDVIARILQQRLSEGLDDEYLRNFYRRFMESEAGHYHLFIELAETYVNKPTVRKRWQEWLTCEAEIMKKLEIRGDRMH